uniref:SRA stem-loop interacting RNA binding protein n=1 Tax=Nannospalax galili TaxID=1026970 RepID=A0A8C6W8H9_NANGA
ASAVRRGLTLAPPVAFIRRIPWTAASSECERWGRDRETGFHKGIGWVQFSSQEELQNALQQENHIIDGVKLQVLAQRPKVLEGDQTSDEE